jgi:hypothetical protein
MPATLADLLAREKFEYRPELASVRSATCVYAAKALSNGTISIGGGFKAAVSKPDWSSSAIFANLLRRQSITVHSKQPGEIVIEVDEVELTLGFPALTTTCRPRTPAIATLAQTVDHPPY